MGSVVLIDVDDAVAADRPNAGREQPSVLEVMWKTLGNAGKARHPACARQANRIMAGSARNRVFSSDLGKALHPDT